MAQNENIANRKKQETIKKTVKPSRASWPNHLIYTMQTNTKFCQLPTTAALKKSQWVCFHADNRVVPDIPGTLQQ
ncbi:uncharacterized protein AFUA_2G11890 [Aspergillus fumigatus Af293]|uniref:Uncharacterized protein n=2 Tax=Aspergillus fumigatus TaxID=746128 RepID=Q4X0Y2_ASPFU|nr:hypothetical protein AFUA_2G11890 [Aspergillus fumigatus Af293]EAL93483.1 hypothetical protein AFUA_2G11890 [Aspergillus fumigatus Af293]EDP54702.1 hypothetical protein AFUB_027630 [Aspergillus fumigatus A1163]